MSSKKHQNKYKLESPYKESDLQAKIGRWIKTTKPHWIKGSLCEVKIVTGGTLAFSKFEDQQLPCLFKSYREGHYYKMSDMALVTKPADFFVANDGWVFCQFWKNHQQEICYYMHIAKVMKIKNSGAKSISEQDFMLNGFQINLAPYKKGITKPKK